MCKDGVSSLYVEEESKTAFIGDKKGRIYLFDLLDNPPIVKQVAKTKEKGTLSSIDVDAKEGRIFAVDESNGLVSYFEIETPIDADSPIDLVSSYLGPKKGRVMKYSSKRQELYVGHTDGKLTIYEVNNLDSGPICTSPSNPRLYKAAQQGHTRDNPHRIREPDNHRLQGQGHEGNANLTR